MCIVAFSYHQKKNYPLILLSNRDEFRNRPTLSLDFWADKPHILAGRDLLHGGTWAGVNQSGCYAIITNYRNPSALKYDSPSRGHIISLFLDNHLTPEEFCIKHDSEFNNYNPFNILMGDRHSLIYYSNMTHQLRILTPGLYGLSNHLLNTPWPKVKKIKHSLTHYLEHHDTIETESLFSILHDTTRPIDHDLPNTGIGLEWERLLSSIFIDEPNYGTCASTIMTIDHCYKIQLIERSFRSTQPLQFEDRHFEIICS